MTRNVETDPRRSRLAKWILRVLVAIVLCTMMAVVNYIWLNNELDNPLPFIGFDCFLVISFICTVRGKKPLVDIADVWDRVAPFWLRPDGSWHGGTARSSDHDANWRRDIASVSKLAESASAMKEPPANTGGTPTQNR